MVAPVPAIEISDHAHPLGVGRPHGKAGSGHPINSPELGAEFVVDASLVALAEEIEIGFAESGQKRVSIAGATDFSLGVRDHQIVGIDALGLVGGPLEEPAFVETFELNGWFI